MAARQVVFITGASRGIGLATARKFLAADWRVAAFYHQQPGPTLDNVAWYQLEMTDGDSINRAITQAHADCGQIDCFVNCAGIFGYKNLLEYDEELIDQVIGVNEKGAYLCTKAVLDHMKNGSIVFISSTAAQIGSSDPIYAGTKAAMLGLTKSLAKTLAPQIRVNCVAPGVTKSDMTKRMNPDRLAQHIEMTLLKRMAQPQDIANVIYFLASDDARHITGACLDVNGGYVLR